MPRLPPLRTPRTWPHHQRRLQRIRRSIKKVQRKIAKLQRKMATVRGQLEALSYEAEDMTNDITVALKATPSFQGARPLVKRLAKIQKRIFPLNKRLARLQFRVVSRSRSASLLRSMLPRRHASRSASPAPRSVTHSASPHSGPEASCSRPEAHR